MTEDKSKSFFSHVRFIFSPLHWPQTHLWLLDLSWALGVCSSGCDLVDLPFVSHHQHSLTYHSSRVLNKVQHKEKRAWGVRLTTCLPGFSVHRWDIPAHHPGTLEWGGLVGEWPQASRLAQAGCLWSPCLLPARWCRPQDCTHTRAGAAEEQSQVDKCCKLSRFPRHAPKVPRGIPITQLLSH